MAPTHAPKWKTETLIRDQGQPLARLDGALWPSVGALVDLPDRRPARSGSVRLSLAPSVAQVVIDIESGPV